MFPRVMGATTPDTGLLHHTEEVANLITRIWNG